MQGRELDAKVAEALGFQGVKYGEDELGEYAYMISSEGGKTVQVPRFSTTWEGMGVLVEEAKKRKIFLEYEHDDHGYVGRAWEGGYSPDTPVVKSAPLAVTIAFLKVRGVEYE